MLVLTRRENQRLYLHVPGLDRPIAVQIVALRPGQVRIGIDADPSVVVLREELVEGKSEADVSLTPRGVSSSP